MPFGAHTMPMPEGANLSLPVIAILVAESLTEPAGNTDNHSTHSHGQEE